MFNHPSTKFTVRELSAKTKISRASVNRYLNQLRKRGIVSAQNELSETSYVRFIKSTYAIDKLYTSGLVEHIAQTLNPSVVIIFGSIRKGEYDANSDIDIFIETTKKKSIDLAPYSKKLRQDVQLFVEDDINKHQPQLFNNIINGIKLAGYVKLK